jgi:hypothetical protein
MPDDIIASVREEARQQAHEYADGEERPLGGYLKALGTFGASVAALAAVARAAGRSAPDLGAKDLVLLTLATHKLARLTAKDPITSPLRVPFTRFKGVSAPPELDEDVRGHGSRHAVGELVTCPFCLAPWAATALLGGYVLAPGTARAVCTALTAVAGADFLQYAYAAAQKTEQ